MNDGHGRLPDLPSNELTDRELVVKMERWLKFMYGFSVEAKVPEASMTVSAQTMARFVVLAKRALDAQDEAEKLKLEPPTIEAAPVTDGTAA